MGQVRQFAAQALDHPLVVEVAEHPRDDQHPAAGVGVGVGEHETQLVLAEDRHQRIHHGADAHAGQEQRVHLPPVGQLAGHHIARLAPQGGQPGRDAGDAALQLGLPLTTPESQEQAA